MMYDWNELEAMCKGCRKCGLCEGRKNVVFGKGDRNADILFIGEGPGEQEDLKGEPFVGRAGKLLDDMLAAVGLDRQSVYIANIVKCRPPKNRDPLPEEQEACIGWLRNQVWLIKPKIIVCLGRIAAGVIINKDFKISVQHGQWTDRTGCKLTAIFHPAALLRNPNLKGDTLDDLFRIKAEADVLKDTNPGMAEAL